MRQGRVVSARIAAAVAVIAVAAAGTADAAPCPALDAAPLPPLAAKPASAASLQASRALAEQPEPADREACDLDQGNWADHLLVARMITAVRIEPANTHAWLGLAVAAEADARDLDASTPYAMSVRAILAIALLRVRDAGWRGCAPCMEYLAGLKPSEAQAADPAFVEVMLTVDAGPPGALADATRAVVAALLQDWNTGDAAPPAPDAWLAAAPYVDARTDTVAGGRVVRGRKGLRAWMDTLNTGFPGPGTAMWCDARCCHYPFIDDGPHKLQMTDVCFDARRHLTRISTEDSGM